MQSNQQSLAFRLENGKSPEALHLFAAGVQLDTLQAASRSIPQNGGTTSIEGRVVQRKVKTRHQPFPPKTWLEGENNLTKKPSTYTYYRYRHPTAFFARRTSKALS